MRGYKLIIAFLVYFYNEVHGHPFRTRSRSIHRPLFRDTCSYTCNDLTSLLALSRTLDEQEEPEKEVVSSPMLFDALIMKLVNALVYATTQRDLNHCHCQCPHSVKSSISDDSRYNGRVNPPSHSDNGHSSSGLVNLDLFNPNNKGNVLDLDLSNQHLLGVGLGGRNQVENSYASSSAYSRTSSNDAIISSSRASNAKKSDGLVDALSNSKNQNNAALGSLGRQNVAGVDLLGDTNGNGRKDTTKEDLVNLKVLNLNKDNNVAELAVGGETILGVGIGGSNDG